MKKFLLRFVAVVVLVTGLMSCAKDTDVYDPYANWEKRNVEFLDSIASVVASPPEGEVWRKYENYKIKFDDDDLNISTKPYEYQVYDYVYVKYESEEDVYEDTDNPLILITDTVNVAYQGFLRNGERFDGNYVGTFDKEVNDNFTKFALDGNSGIITGWPTALIHMKPEVYVEMYIPYQMAYGERGNGDIPGYSVLKFELYVDEVIHPKVKQ